VTEAGRGLVALGDSITRGRGGTPALGVHYQSWAQWVAEAMGLPFTNLAADGTLASDVLAEQVPRLDGPYDVAALFVGVNDARSTGWDPGRYEHDVHAIARSLREAAERVVVLTLPEDLGRPTAAPKPAEANRILRTLAGVEVVELADFGGRRHVLPDAVHPTSVGMLEIARRALAILSPGVEWTVEDSEGPQLSTRRDLRYEAWWWRLWVSDVARRVRERRAAPRG
jgi:lysophospholipase L1-like esterase